MTFVVAPLNGLSLALCEQFGINPDNLTRLTIDMPACQLPTLTVEYDIWEETDVLKITSALARFVLTPVTSPEKG